MYYSIYHTTELVNITSAKNNCSYGRSLPLQVKYHPVRLFFLTSFANLFIVVWHIA